MSDTNDHANTNDQLKDQLIEAQRKLIKSQEAQLGGGRASLRLLQQAIKQLEQELEGYRAASKKGMQA